METDEESGDALGFGGLLGDVNKLVTQPQGVTDDDDGVEGADDDGVDGAELVAMDLGVITGGAEADGDGVEGVFVDEADDGVPSPRPRLELDS